MVNLQDEHLINYFVKNNTLKPIIDVFVANGSRYNLLNSAVLELLEYIKKVHARPPSSLFFWNSVVFLRAKYLSQYIMQENLKLLVIHIIDSFWNQLSRFENLSSIQALKVKYDQVNYYPA